MKQLYVLLCFWILSPHAFSQITKENSLGRDEFIHSQNRDNSEKTDSLNRNPKSVIKTWRLTDMNSSVEIFNMDTTLIEIQNYNPIYRKSISNSYLGNLGTAYQSNVFSDRENEDFLFFNQYRAYMMKPEDLLYFNTTTPFTQLSYKTGGPKGRSENLLKALHTQNILPDWNVGIHYNLISSDGQYQYQKSKLYHFTFFSSYKKQNYVANFVMNANRMGMEESGGVVNDSLITNLEEKAENIQMNLSQATSKLTNFNFFLTHSYGFGAEKKQLVEEDSTCSYAINLLHTLKYEHNGWQFKDANLNANFYADFFLNQNETFDKVEQSLLKNTMQIVFHENENKWIRLGARFGIENEFVKYRLRRNVSQYALKQEEERIHNNWLIASLFSLSGKSLNWKAVAKYVFEGYRQNDFELDYGFTKWIGEKEKEHGFKLSGKLKSESPNFLLEEYYGNHQQWNTDFKKQTKLCIEGEYFDKKYEFQIGGNFTRLENYTFWGLQAMPEQAKSGISVLSAYLQKDFRLGHFHLKQNLVVQSSSNDDVLPLPNLSIYSDNYYQNQFFDKAFDLKVGISVRYHSSFYAPAYMPSIGQFYLQKEKKLGNYPKLNLYMNFRIGRTCMFVMYEHANSWIGSTNYFSALHYPIDPAMVKYGLVWTFYD